MYLHCGHQNWPSTARRCPLFLALNSVLRRFIPDAAAECLQEAERYAPTDFRYPKDKYRQIDVLRALLRLYLVFIA